MNKIEKEEWHNTLWHFTGYDLQHGIYLKYAHHDVHKHRCRSKRMERTNVRYVKMIELKRKKGEATKMKTESKK